MKTLRIMLIAGSALAVSTGAEAGSSFTFLGTVERAPSMVELGEQAPPTPEAKDGEASAQTTSKLTELATSPEMPANKTPAELAKSTAGPANGEASAPPPALAKSGAGGSQAGADETMKSVAGAKSPDVTEKQSAQSDPAATPSPAVDPTVTASAPKDDSPVGKSPFNFSQLRH